LLDISMLSVVIATFDSERVLVPTLAMLVPAAMSGIVREVIIADGGSTDATLEVADVAGCTVLASSAPLAQRLREAAAAARSPWLMFLRPGTVLDTTWLDETAHFVEETERGEAVAAAVFRKAVSPRASYPIVLEALGLLKFSLLARVGPDQGLVISTRLYRELAGHRDGVADPEADLLARLGRRRILMLRSGARS
jgi:cellulose synthase/poly-beta-1,6-N-acetylglucosamine synthase-like glycosyltransferase